MNSGYELEETGGQSDGFNDKGAGSTEWQVEESSQVA